jgi:hypothetical protein
MHQKAATAACGLHANHIILAFITVRQLLQLLIKSFV